MKKITIIFLAVSSLCIAFPAFAATTPTNDPLASNSNTAPLDTAAQIKALEERLVEIKEMDKSALTRSEKKELKSEVKEIKSEMKALGGGVYISAGALIVILILLIILI